MNPDESIAIDIESSWIKRRDETLERRLLQCSGDGISTIVFKILKTKLVNVNAKDENNATALMKAAKGGHLSVVQMLIEAGCDVNLTNTLLVTPLHIAAKYDKVDIVKLLILAGAKYNLKNREALIPIDYAPYKSETWQVLQNASFGEMPEIEEINEVPVIPDFAIEMGTGEKKKKKKGGKKGKKKGKAGKKKGKKKK